MEIVRQFNQSEKYGARRPRDATKTEAVEDGGPIEP